MKKLETLRRYYHKLTPVERVNLVLEAQGRDDHTEVDVLEHACPVAQSAAYEGRVIVIADIATMMIIQLLACAVFVVTKTADLTREPDDAPSALDPALRSILERQAAIWRGFAAWCRDVEHDPRQVLHFAPIGPDESDPAFFLVHSQIDAIESWSGDPQNPFPDPHQVDMWREVFAQAFQLAKLEELV
jgi:hypothetical protein